MVTPAHDYDVVIGKMAITTEYRGKGVGSQLLKSVVDKCLESGKTVSLFSEMDAFYEKIGFKRCHPPCAGYVYFMKPNADLVDTYAKANLLDENTHISLYIESNHFDEVASYDAMAQGYENRTFMNLLMRTGDAAMVAVNNINQRIIGYATAAFAQAGKVLAICGLKADSDVIAFWLFRNMYQRFPDLSEIRLSSLRKDPFLKQFGMTSRYGGPFNRMVIGEGDITINDPKLYVPKGLDFTY